MGWQDDPMVGQTGKSWQDDPIVSRPATAMDRVNAVAAGANHGVLSDLAGLPVDAAANAIDLLKAGYGYAASKFPKGTGAIANPSEIKAAIGNLVSGKSGQLAPDWTSPYDRTQVPGTSAWIDKKLTDSGAGAVINNPAPQDVASRILFNTSRGVSGSAVPGGAASGAQIARNAAMAGAASGAGATAAEIWPNNPAASIVASFLPQAGVQTASGLTKLAVRGGEAGRQNMAQRVQDLKNAGIENPSLGLSSGSPLIQGVENLLSKIPGSVGTFQNASKGNIQGMQNKVASLRDQASPEYGPGLAGSAIQNDINGFPVKISEKYNGLMGKVGESVGKNTYIPVENAISTTRSLATPSPAAPETTSLLSQPRIKSLYGAIQSDNAPLRFTDDSLRNRGGQSILKTIPDTEGLPFGAVKDIRTRIGQEQRSKDIVATPQEAQLKRVYGALSEDMGQGINSVDRKNAGVPVGPLLYEQQPATNAWDRANNYYSAGMNRLDEIKPLLGKTPEQAYQSLLSSANGNVSALQAIKKSISPETRAKVAATYLDELGSARPGAQDNMGSVFSPETFLTNWNKPAQQGRSELLSGFPGAPAVASGAADVAKGASMLRDASKIWANPSGTSGNMMAAGTLGGIAGNLFAHPVAAAGSIAGLLGGNAVSNKLLLNPDFVKRMSEIKAINDPALKAQYQSQLQNAIINSTIPGLLSPYDQ